MRKLQAGLLSVFVLLGVIPAVNANAHDNRDSVYVDLPVYGSGDFNIGRWLDRHTRFDPDYYQLTGVIVHTASDRRGQGHRNSHRRQARYDGGNGTAVLRIGDHVTSRVALNRGDVFIQAPPYDRGKWRLFLQDGARVRGVTLLVAPRFADRGYRNRDHHDDGRRRAWH
ncbi:MAG: hypothetical protein H6993_03930 [Pseudomonadales bacterium]|nr:hypothetical protein [Pseudomonadales bacterium]MCP5183084.1 hypothetical protein [Pseudomonadales bacterium]